MVELKYYKLKSKFNQDVESSSVTNDDLVFIEDTKELYTHGTFFGQGDYCILNYNNIESSTGDPYVGNIDSTINVYIQFVEGDITYIIPAIVGKATQDGKSLMMYVATMVTSGEQSNDISVAGMAVVHVVEDDTYTVTSYAKSTKIIADDEKAILTNLRGKTYITGGEGVQIDSGSITVPARTFDGEYIVEDNLVLVSATNTTAGVMSADDKKALDDATDKLSTYDVIKTKALFGDRFVVHIDGVLEYNDIRSNVMTSLAPSGSHDTVGGLYLVNGYISGSKPTAMLKVNDNYYTQWNATTYYSNPIPAYNKKVGDYYVIKDTSENLSTTTLFTYKHYADQSVQQMYHVNSNGVIASVTEALNDYVYEQVLLN